MNAQTKLVIENTNSKASSAVRGSFTNAEGSLARIYNKDLFSVTGQQIEVYSGYQTLILE